MKYIDTAKTLLIPQPIFIQSEKDGVQVEVAIQYTDGYAENVFSFANNINTIEGGTHLVGFKAALTRTINNYAASTNLFEKERVTLGGDDVREGRPRSSASSWPSRSSQTKTKLGNWEVKGIAKRWSAMGSASTSRRIRPSDAGIEETSLRVHRARGRSQGARSRAPQDGARVRLAARQAGRLRRARSARE